MELTKSSTSKIIYLDANIFLNVWFKEMMKFGTIYTSSKKLLEEIIDCKYFLLISNLVVHELAKKMGVSEYIIEYEYLKEFKITNKIKIIKISKKIADDASLLYASHGIHMADAIHATAAIANNCLLVTRDGGLHETAKNIELECEIPEKLIQ